MLVIFSIYDRIKLLPYFLRYYSSIGATRFECALYKGAASSLYSEILNFKSGYNLNVRTSVSCETDKYDGTLVAPVLNEIRRELAAQFKWYCIADLDEFHFFQGRTMPEIVKEAEANNYDAVHGVFFDRIAADGTFPEIRGTLDDTFPLACDLSALSGVCSDKFVLARNNIEVTAGHHNAKGARLWRNAAEVHHFKWAKGADKAMEDRYRRAKVQGQWWANNFKMLLDIAKSRIDISNPKLNTRRASRIGI